MLDKIFERTVLSPQKGPPNILVKLSELGLRGSVGLRSWVGVNYRQRSLSAMIGLSAISLQILSAEVLSG